MGTDGVVGSSVLQRSPTHELSKVAGALEEADAVAPQPEAEPESEPEAEPEPEPEPEQERSKRGEDARFLMQSTFGPTAELLEELKNVSYADWIQKQLQLPVESHREYFRRRVNPAWDSRVLEQAMKAAPCQGRFRNFVFAAKDQGKSVSVNESSILVDGKLRSGVKPFPLASTWLGMVGFKGSICHVTEELGGDVVVAKEGGNCWHHKQTLPNPSIWMSKGGPELTGPLQQVKPGVLVANEGASCTLASDGSPVFAQAGGEHFIYEERFHLLGNTPGQPSLENSVCVPRSHLNEKSCGLPQVTTGDTAVGLLAEVHEMTDHGRYLSQARHSKFVTYVVDETINGFAGFPPLPGRIVIHWSGNLAIRQPGKYVFYLTSDDGSELKINGTRLIDNGGWHGMQERHGEITLSAGSHAIEVDYYDGGGGRGIKLEWQGPESLDLREVLRSSALSVKAKSFQSGACIVSCGSPGEVASEPALGHQLPMRIPVDRNGLLDDNLDNKYASGMHGSLGKSTVWTMKVLQAGDQLRQRMAWALSQIIVVSTQGVGDDSFNEMWINFYDIFVRNAFGSYKDILREVTFSPLMGTYLTHTGSSSYDYNRNMPNENYGREIMQLFTIGLNMLNPDGTEPKDAHGASIPTYTNENILNMARVFTGFLEQRPRGNSEFRDERSNRIDPMTVSPAMHDVHPKPDLRGGYIGDGYMSCSDAVLKGAFLRRGARFEFWGLHNGNTEGLVLPNASVLGKTLCGADLQCSKAVVLLEADVACAGKECTAASVELVRVGDYWYKHVPPPCVHTFFMGPTRVEADGPETKAEEGWCQHWDSVKLDDKDGDSEARQEECKAKCRAANGTGCELVWGQHHKGCYVLHWTKNYGGLGHGRHCWSFQKKGLKGRSYMLAPKGMLSCPAGAEIYDVKECEQAVEALGLPLTAPRHLNTRNYHRYPHGCSYGHGRIFFSVAGTEYQPTGSLPPVCRTFITMGGDGTVVMNNGHTKFTLPDLHPPPSPGVHVVNTVTRVLFSQLPKNKAEALAKLKTGAPVPVGNCSVCQGPVKAYGSAGQDLDEDTVLEVDGKFFKNVESRVQLEDGRSFRNPPVFLKSVQDLHAEKQVLAEVEATLDHLFHHPNTPVFIGRRLIQRFVSSNPSPGYVAAVSGAFSTGTYNGVTYSGQYGDLGATVAAVLLHPEARVLATNQRTSARGSLREPIMKLIHLMRSMRYQDKANEQVVFQQLQDAIGQFPYQAPSVFNYYLADYDLPMISAEPEPEPEEPEPEPESPEPEPESEEPEPEPESEPENLFGPEFQIFTPPFLVGYLNGMQSMIQSGVDSQCTSGKDLGISVSQPDDGDWRQVCPQGSLSWDGAGSPNRTVEELNVLLTGGRLTPVAKEVVMQAYNRAGEGQKIKAAQKAVVMTAEFNTLGAPLPLPGTRPPLPSDSGDTRASYKAVVFLFLAGGADTWNMLVPQDCDLYEEYRVIRTDLTMEPGELSKVQTTGQKCTSFGIHASFDFVKKRYDQGEAAFVTNVGNLVEPTTMQTFRSGAAQKCFNLFSHSDQQNGAMTLKCQQMGTTAFGAGGRIADALAAGSQGMRTESFSLAGSSVWSKGAITRREIVDDHGSKTFKGYEEWMPSIANLTSQRHGNVYAEAYSEAFLRGLETSQNLGRTLQEASTKTNYNTNGRLKRQLFQVAKLISARDGRKAERDFFFVSVGGWDMHSNLKMGLQNGFGVVDDALQGFVEELEAQDVWKSVVIMTSSEFARTLDSNGGGSDHAWAGQQVILGGSLKGGKVFNKFPASLLPGSARDLGRGRLIPEYPWESMLVPIAEWLGVTTDQYATTFPNLANFNASHIIPTSNLLQ